MSLPTQVIQIVVREKTFLERVSYIELRLLLVGSGHVNESKMPLLPMIILLCLRRERRIVTTVGLSVISANRTDHLVLIIAGNNKK